MKLKVLLATLLLSACVQPKPPVTAPFDVAAAEAFCRATWQQELQRPIDDGGLASCVSNLRSGWTHQMVVDAVRTSPEYARLHTKPPVVQYGPVHMSGTRFVTATGVTWHYRSVTALDLVASSQREAFLDWAQKEGFTAVRFLATASITAKIPPGAKDLPNVFADIRKRGLGAEVVVLADTQPQGLSKSAMLAHAKAVAASLPSDMPIIVELANENAHPTQQKDLTDLAFLKQLRAVFPKTVPVSYGSNCCGQPDTLETYPGGDYITLHLDRHRPEWDEVRRIKDFIDTQHAIKKRIVDDEPIGAAEKSIPSKRSAARERFFAQGILDRLGEVDGTFHCDDCVVAKVPGPVQQQCAEAYIDGATFVPDADRFEFHNDSNIGAATHGADWTKVEKLFTFVNTSGGKSYLVALNVKGSFNPTWANGWHMVSVAASRSGIQVLEISK